MCFTAMGEQHNFIPFLIQNRAVINKDIILRYYFKIMLNN